MQSRSPKSNRGPAVAAQNRAAILAAARTNFEAHGYQVPLSTIAKAAGVSQGVFYRHFRSRLDLATEVFTTNIAELRTLAEDDDSHAFVRFWRRVLEMTVSEVAFLEMAYAARDDIETRLSDLDFATLTESLLRRAQEAGVVRATLTFDDVLLTQRMAYGIAKSREPHEDVAARLSQMLRLLQLPEN